jgi:hypothetical protein
MKKQVYTRDEVVSIIAELMLCADQVLDHINNEDTNISDEDLFEMAVKDMAFEITGIDHIFKERQRQIDNHGFTAKHHAKNPQWYDKGQLIYAAIRLVDYDKDSFTEIYKKLVPENWDLEWWERLCDKPKEERKIIAGALISAELDRLDYLEKYNSI